MGALLRVNVFAGQGDTEPQVLPTPEPIYRGRLIKLSLGAGVQIAGVTDYVLCEDTTNPKPFQYWADGEFLYLYAFGNIPATIAIKIVTRSRITPPDNYVYEIPVQSQIDSVSTNNIDFAKSPDPVLSVGEFVQEGQTLALSSRDAIALGRNLVVSEENWNYLITLGTDAIVSRIESLGLEFLPTSQARPNPGEFKQVGTQIIICGSPQFHLDFGQEVICTGDRVIPIDATAALQIATFYLPTVFYLEKIEWLGIAFSPAQDSDNPQKNEFVWHNGYATTYF